MTLAKALRIVEAEAIAKMALDTQLGSYDDAIALVEDILPAKDAAIVADILREWREIDRFDAEVHMDHDSEI